MKNLGLASTFACVLASASTLAQNAYITNLGSNTVSVITTDQHGGRFADPGRPQVPVGLHAAGVAVTSKVYVAKEGSDTVSIIDMATNTVIGWPIPVGDQPVAF